MCISMCTCVKERGQRCVYTPDDSSPRKGSKAHCSYIRYCENMSFYFFQASISFSPPPPPPHPLLSASVACLYSLLLPSLSTLATNTLQLSVSHAVWLYLRMVGTISSRVCPLCILAINSHVSFSRYRNAICPDYSYQLIIYTVLLCGVSPPPPPPQDSITSLCQA